MHDVLLTSTRLCLYADSDAELGPCVSRAATTTASASSFKFVKENIRITKLNQTKNNKRMKKPASKKVKKSTAKNAAPKNNKFPQVHWQEHSKRVEASAQKSNKKKRFIL